MRNLGRLLTVPRKRHIKCDESKPTCKQCTRAGRVCERSSAPENNRVRRIIIYTPKPALSETPDLTPSEQRALDHFYSRTRIGLAGDFRSSFWSKEWLLPMISHDKSIRHAIIALSSMHESFVDGAATPSDGLVGFANAHYSKAMREVARLTDADEHATDFALISCMLFATIEAVQGDYYTALSHVASGVRIMTEDKAKVSPRRGLYIDRTMLLRFFHTIDAQIMEFGDPNFQQSTSDLLMFELESPESFTSYDDALASLERLLRDIFRFADRWDQLVRDPQARDDAILDARETHVRLQGMLDRWVEALSALPAPSNDDDATALSVLSIYRIVMRAFLQRVIECDDNCYDAMLPELWEVLTIAEDIVKQDEKRSRSPRFSLSIGIVPVLYLLSTAINDANLRERALDLLRTCKRREGLWDSDLAARIAEHFQTLKGVSSITQADMNFLPGKKLTLRYHTSSSSPGLNPSNSECYVVVEWDS